MRVIFTGAGGFIGRRFLKRYSGELEIHATWFISSPQENDSRVKWERLDIRDEPAVKKYVRRVKPDAVIHAAALASVSACEKNPELAALTNVSGTKNVARAAASTGAYMVYLSTDMVFSGEDAPYAEDAKPDAQSVYGKTKGGGEAHCPPDGLVLRLALGYGRSLDAGRKNFFEEALTSLAEGKDAAFFSDEWRTPLWVEDTVQALGLILNRKPSGILHLGGPERMSREDMARRACRVLNIPQSGIKAVPRKNFPGPPRPGDLSFNLKKLNTILPDFKLTSFEESIGKDFSEMGK